MVTQLWSGAGSGGKVSTKSEEAGKRHRKVVLAGKKEQDIIQQ